MDQAEDADGVCAALASREIKNVTWWQAIPWDAMHEAVRTVRVVPEAIKSEVAALRGGLASAAQSSRGSAEEASCWKAFLFLDRILFCTAKKTARRHARAKG